jgi:hypothetical protein
MPALSALSPSDRSEREREREKEGERDKETEGGREIRREREKD